VIAVTALGNSTDLERTWAAGFDGHLNQAGRVADFVTTPERVLWARRGL
jgi:hypothetical protein